MKNIAYIGWLGRRNVGDEAIYLANKKLFSDFNLIEEKYINDSQATLFGGGTILPQALFGAGYDPIKRKLNYGVGVGIRQQQFDNRRKEKINIRRILGERGVNLPRKIRNLPKPARYAIEVFESELLNERVSLSDFYFSESEYMMIDNYGFDRLSVRGPESQAQLTKFGIECEITGDPALILEPEKYTEQTTSKIAVCLRGRPDDYSWAKNEDYIKTIISFCKRKSNKYNFVFLPFDPRDIQLNYTASQQVPNSSFKDFTTYIDVEALLQEITSCDLMIGEKLHANVLAACCSVPFISIEYSPKHSDFAKSIKMHEFNIKNSSLTQESIELAFNKLYNNKRILNRLDQQVTDRRLDLWNFVRNIRDDISNHMRE